MRPVSSSRVLRRILVEATTVQSSDTTFANQAHLSRTPFSLRSSVCMRIPGWDGRRSTTRSETTAGSAAGSEWVDYPADGHPEEDLMNALHGGIRDAMPEGGILAAALPRMRACRVLLTGLCRPGRAQSSAPRKSEILPLTVSTLRRNTQKLRCTLEEPIGCRTLDAGGWKCSNLVWRRHPLWRRHRRLSARSPGCFAAIPRELSRWPAELCVSFRSFPDFSRSCAQSRLLGGENSAGDMGSSQGRPVPRRRGEKWFKFGSANRGQGASAPLCQLPQSASPTHWHDPSFAGSRTRNRRPSWRRKSSNRRRAASRTGTARGSGIPALL